ncbi:DUF3086 domain-containing protein [Leptolyngbya sp. FACHB-261]|uniref:DUF3086 domain-containing protein n=1 Tax=Leptolyngbya sp. FACHB-261 TaxID=2692806 RepID=UPI001687B084|nr:DUF3086 domain-containing protein [Leptolyngbya sp. FACHB-261]MBD2102277.1 DUF3086 domain-containing protein [Leptolyngbya sp. FACHB-261]
MEDQQNQEQAVASLEQRLAALQQQEQELQQAIEDLRNSQSRVFQEQITELQNTLGRLMQESLSELEHRKQALQESVSQLERRQERIQAEMRKNFAGASQDLAIRVQGFKDYMVGSLQDLVLAAEQLELVPPAATQKQPEPEEAPAKRSSVPEQGFPDQAKKIRQLLEQYRALPDYYGPSWQLRRTFEKVHEERVTNWFFTLAGRGAVKSMGSRLQNILVASAVISVLRVMHGNRLRVLILATLPERLGEWRRGLQDCLGIARADFGPDGGVVLFEDPDPMVQKADRLLADGDLPMLIFDEAEEQVSLNTLRFPLWLAFGLDAQQMTRMMY